MLTKLIINKSLPISLCDAKEFKNFCHSLDSRYNPPTSKTFMRSHVPATYDLIVKLIQLKLGAQTVPSVNLSCDLWSDPIMRSFIAFCCHFINENWELVNCVIGCVRMFGSHTYDAIYATRELIPCS